MHVTAVDYVSILCLPTAVEQYSPITHSSLVEVCYDSFSFGDGFINVSMAIYGDCTTMYVEFAIRNGIIYLNSAVSYPLPVTTIFCHRSTHGAPDNRNIFLLHRIVGRTDGVHHGGDLPADPNQYCTQRLIPIWDNHGDGQWCTVNYDPKPGGHYVGRTGSEAARLYDALQLTSKMYVVVRSVYETQGARMIGYHVIKLPAECNASIIYSTTSVIGKLSMRTSMSQCLLYTMYYLILKPFNKRAYFYTWIYLYSLPCSELITDSKTLNPG